MNLRELLVESVRLRCADVLDTKVERFIRPSEREQGVSSFSVAVLENGSIGVSYNLFHRDACELARFREWNLGRVVGRPSGEAARLFLSEDALEKTAGLAVLNALSQDYIRRNPGAYRLDFKTDIADLAGLDSSFTVGLVGYFTPMIPALTKHSGKVIVLEKDKGLLAGTYPFTMTDDPRALEGCDSVLITATTVLNDTLPGLLPFCKSSRMTAVMGPSAGFLPDALFELGVHAVGGTWIDDPKLFLDRFESGVKWGDSTRKFWFLQGS